MELYSRTQSSVAILICAILLPSLISAQETVVDDEHSKKMAAGLVLFKTEVKPVLVGRCLKCHAGKEADGEFDLSNRKSLLAGGSSGPAIMIGKSKSSLLYKMITHEVEPSMPEDGAKLDKRNIDALSKWIDLGAPYDAPLEGKPADPLAWTKKTIDPTSRSFWSFQPIKKSSVPKVENDQWCQTDIDRFVLEKLQNNGMSPNQVVDQASLARRMYLSVIGLPPNPKQLVKFVNDKSPKAIDKLIDGLLGSQHYGEKWARHWLDIARFAESHGFEQDYDRPHAYHYRDFVIKALNSDMPYNQFVKWQIAGDELAPNEPLALMATGFLGAGVFPTQLTEKEFEPARYDEMDDMASTVGTAMLGLTIGCARCHDHKFDPIPQRDYYQFVSTFTTTIRGEVELELDPDSIKKKLKQWQVDHDQLQSQMKKYEKEKLSTSFDRWLGSKSAIKPIAATWVVLDFSKAISKGGATFEKLPDGSLLAKGKNSEFDSYEFVAKTNLKGISAIRVEAMADASLVRKGPGRASNGNFALGDFSVTARNAGAADWVPIKLVRPRSTFEQNTSNLSVAASIDSNPKTGWAVDPQFGKNHAAIFEFEKPTQFETETELTIRMRFDVNNKHSIGRPRISITTSSTSVGFDSDTKDQAVVEIFEILKNSNGNLTDAQRNTLFQWYRTTDEGWKKLNGEIQAHLAKKPRPIRTKVMVSSEGLKPLKHNADGRNFPHFYPTTHFLNRGDSAQKQGVAKQGFLQIYAGDNGVSNYQGISPKSGRLSYRRSALVRWMTDTDKGPGQQLARVVVNRIWQHYFGRGIVNTPNDFGFQGERPSHPELLDWLAQRLIDEKWSLKAIHRLILKSAIYQQSSEFNDEDSRKDLDNKLLWRYSPRRLEAEIIRDSMLAVSGTLDKKMFGAGTLDEKMKRRSVYFMIKRSKLIPMMQIFDSPEPLVSVGSRPSTTIAPQALLFMNNSNVREYARNFSKKILKSNVRDSKRSQSSDSQLKLMVGSGFEMALARNPSPMELKNNIDFIQSQFESYAKEKQNNALEMAVTDFCQVLFCLNEFIYVD